MKPITVLFDASILGTDTRTRGVGRYVVDAMREMSALAPGAGVRLRFLTRLSLSELPGIVDDPEVAIESLLATPAVSNHHWAYRLRLTGSLAARLAGADLFHVPHPFATPLFDPGAVRLTSCHDLVPLRFPEHYVNYKDGFVTGRKALDRRRMRRADHIMAISEATKRDIVRLLDVPPEKVTVLYLGMSERAWPPDPPETDRERIASLGIDKPFVLYVGAADWRKNQHGMFDAVARARARGRDIEMVWAGRLGDKDRARVDADVARYGTPVRLVGYVDDATLQALYRQALATLFCSFVEGFGYPLLEAMALACPVITSNCSSLPEVAGDAALLVDPADPEAIAAAIERLMDEPGLADELRRRGPERAKLFTARRMAENHLELYRKLTA